MSYRRFNASIVTGNFTGATTGASVNGGSLHIGETQRDVQNISARIIATITMTNATVKAQWQGSNDNAAWDNVAHSPENPAGVALATGVASGTTLGVGAPEGVYGYKYARCQLLWTSTTAGTTNDAMSIGYTYRQLDAGGA